MTLPDERYRSLLYVRSFIYSLLDPKTRPKTVKELRTRARSALKHYPTSYELEQIAKACPKLLKNTKLP